MINARTFRGLYADNIDFILFTSLQLRHYPRPRQLSQITSEHEAQGHYNKHTNCNRRIKQVLTTTAETGFVWVGRRRETLGYVTRDRTVHAAGMYAAYKAVSRYGETQGQRGEERMMEEGEGRKDHKRKGIAVLCAELTRPWALPSRRWPVPHPWQKRW